MKPLLIVVLAFSFCGCGSIDRIAFTVGYDKATIGVEADLRDLDKNPIARRRHSGK